MGLDPEGEPVTLLTGTSYSGTTFVTATVELAIEMGGLDDGAVIGCEFTGTGVTSSAARTGVFSAYMSPVGLEQLVVQGVITQGGVAALECRVHEDFGPALVGARLQGVLGTTVNDGVSNNEFTLGGGGPT